MMRILVVEPEPVLLRCLANVLEARGHEVVGISEASLSPSMVTCWEPEVVVCDVDAAGDDWVAACRDLKSAVPHLHLLVMTVDEVRAELARANSLGPALVKPFSAADLDGALSLISLSRIECALADAARVLRET